MPRRETGPRHIRSNVPNNKPSHLPQRVMSPPVNVPQSIPNLSQNTGPMSKEVTGPSVSINGGEFFLLLANIL